MKPDDDDFLTGPVPDPDAEPTAAERAQAKEFAELVDKTIASGRMPPAMSADARALLEVATVIRATSGGMELPASRQRSVVEDALRQAVGAAPSTSLPGAPVIPLKRRWLPWTIASASSLVAAAAIVLLVVRKPTQLVAPAPETPLSWRSRPADPLIGRIDNECKGSASAGALNALDCAREATIHTSSRIDHIFADRLEGYRERRFGSRGGHR